MIAAVNGVAIGGGHVLHVLCDLTVAAEHATFGQSGPRVGSFDAGFGSAYLARVIGEKRARQLWFLLDRIDADDRRAVGARQRRRAGGSSCCGTALGWGRRMAGYSPTALRFLKHSFNADSDSIAGLSHLAFDGLELFSRQRRGRRRAPGPSPTAASRTSPASTPSPDRVPGPAEGSAVIAYDSGGIVVCLLDRAMLRDTTTRRPDGAGMRERHTQVLVVGGSLVGLSASVLLASYGVPHLVVESHAGTAIHPRAASFHQRTMEVFRSVGLQAEVEAAAAAEFRQGGAIVAVESLGGKELAYFYRSYNDGVEGLSPTDRLFLTQVGLEPILRRRATELGAEHLFGTDLVSFETRDDHVAAVIGPHGGGAEELVSSDYLVAADGAHSAVRKQLGIPMTGRGSFADCVTIYFKADVNRLIGDRNLSVVYVNHPELTGFFRFSITGDSGFLAVFATLGRDGARNTHVAEDITEARCVELVRTALGSEPDLPVAIESVQRWSATAATADSFQSGRVFLAGDAAHVMPPTGGFGGNTGVADAHNLAWKLAYVTRGIAGPGLLDTYGAERRPIAAITVEQAYARYAMRVDPSLPRDDLMPPFDDAAIELGAICRSSAVHADSRRSAGASIILTTRTRGPGPSVPGSRISRWPVTVRPRRWMRPAPDWRCWPTRGSISGGTRPARSRRPSALPSRCGRSIPDTGPGPRTRPPRRRGPGGPEPRSSARTESSAGSLERRSPRRPGSSAPSWQVCSPAAEREQGGCGAGCRSPCATVSAAVTARATAARTPTPAQPATELDR